MARSRQKKARFKRFVKRYTPGGSAHAPATLSAYMPRTLLPVCACYFARWRRRH